ncbi:hypothetical protein GCM10022416_23520 [Actinomadura keratinilytica]|uniref:tRNA threonylcarbamoyladenosine biosynthesis protein TsaE n=1 Tax=Actinomadura keratinilytica TaxID=547461 RepID=A0ABP7YMD6_9ACTN
MSEEAGRRPQGAPKASAETSAEASTGASGGRGSGETPANTTVTVRVPSAEDMRELGLRLAGGLRAGDLLVLTGDLGAGKTTLTQGIAEGLKVRGPITSPTFVIARVHPPLAAGPPLVHVDAYRLDGFAELDDLDLDAEIAESVTVVEWGRGLAEGLADDRLEIVISRSGDTDERTVMITGVGARWAVALGDLVDEG